MNSEIFPYGEKEMNYLKTKDRQLGEIIDCLGFIPRTGDSDLFSSVVHNIVGQQISTKAQESIWKKMNAELGVIDDKTLLDAGRDRFQKFGITFRKADYILDFAKKVNEGSFDTDAVEQMSDEEAVEYLSSLKGVGVWTAEMILIFCLKRPNILSYGDLAIIRGMRMVYHHRKIDREKFEKYKRRLSPYCSVASFYFWAVANGAVPGMKDYAPKK